MRTFLEFCFKGLAFFFLNKNYRSFIFLMLRIGSRKRYKETKLKIQNYNLWLADGSSFLWQFYEIFFKEIYCFESQSNNPIILDCGANVGTSVLYFKKLFPNAIVHAYEPDPNIFKILEHNVKINKLKGVELYEAAVWKEAGSLNFGSEGSDSGSFRTDASKIISVKTIRLKDVIGSFDHIDFLKIDIEGAEVEVLKDCQEMLANVKHLFVEFHSFYTEEQDLQVILDVLTKSGFRYYLEPVLKRKKVFLNKKGKHSMDNQVNVFAYRIDT